MPRAANPATDFTVPVEGVGTFVFGYRDMKDQLRINVEYSRIVEDVTPTQWLDSLATALATLKVLTVRAPEDWSIDTMDPLDDEVYAKIFKVWGALRDQERSFRQKPQGAGSGAGA